MDVVNKAGPGTRQLPSFGVQGHQLKVRILNFHDIEKLIEAQIGQVRIKQENPIVCAMLLKHLQRTSAGPCLNHIPTGKIQLAIQLLTEPGVGADNEHIDWTSIVVAGELRYRTCHEAFLPS
jgi:hypothetical protein